MSIRYEKKTNNITKKKAVLIFRLINIYLQMLQNHNYGP